MTSSIGSGGQESKRHNVRGRPCDLCRVRKVKCVIEEGAEICARCMAQTLDCTFAQSAPTRKRSVGRLDEPVRPQKRRSSSWRMYSENGTYRETLVSSQTSPSDDPFNGRDPNVPPHSLLNKTLGLEKTRHARYIGSTSAFEQRLFSLCQGRSAQQRGALRAVTHDETFQMIPDSSTQHYEEEVRDLDAIEASVFPHGRALINLYFRIIHPSFPILHKKVYLEKYGRTHREFSPPLLAAVYILALRWWDYSRDLVKHSKPDVDKLEALAEKSLHDVIHRPKLSTVQAGLLLSQRHDGGSWVVSTQVVAMGHELGLHLDCSEWNIPLWERGLRKRLAWALFMQDKWGALIHARPSHISIDDWAVRDVTNEDFPESAEDEDDEEGSSEVEKGRVLFSQMIALTEILSEILGTFYTIRARKEMSIGGNEDLGMILERAKPVQMKLKKWYMNLPDVLKVDNMTVRKLSSVGYLHLAYFASEITLHRVILRALSSSTPPPILDICRSAAETRFMSATNLITHLRPEHLQSFWYFASSLNLAIVGAFGALLWATSRSEGERNVYKARLQEYRWCLRVSSKGAEFMEVAVDAINDSMEALEYAEKEITQADYTNLDRAFEHVDWDDNVVDSLAAIHVDTDPSEVVSQDAGNVRKEDVADEAMSPDAWSTPASIGHALYEETLESGFQDRTTPEGLFALLMQAE